MSLGTSDSVDDGRLGVDPHAKQWVHFWFFFEKSKEKD